MRSLSSLVDAAIRGKSARNAAVIVHHNVGIVPLTSEFDTRTVIRSETSEERRPVIHVEIDLFAVGVGADPASHSAAQVHPEDLAARRAQIARSANARVWINFAARRRGIEAHKDHVFPGLRVERAPSLPVGKEIELAAHEESPGSEDSSDKAYEHEAEDQGKE